MKQDGRLPQTTIDKWQKLIDSLGKSFELPACLIMRLEGDWMEVFAKSSTPKNPYLRGSREKRHGLYCNAIICTKSKLIVPNALSDPEWMENPDLKLGMIAYLGFPVFMPDGSVFGTVCVLDNKENSFSREIEELLNCIKEIIELDITSYWSFEQKSIVLEQKVLEQCNAIEKANQSFEKTKIGLTKEQLEGTELSPAVKTLYNRSFTNEEKYFTLLKNINSATVLFKPVWDANGKMADAIYMDMNPMNEQIIGFKKEEVLGKSILDVFPETEREWFERFECIFAKNKSVNFDLYHKELKKHFSVNAFGLADDLFCVLYYDITDTINLRKKLDEQKNQYRSLFDTISTAIVLFEPITDEKGELVDLRYFDMNAQNESFLALSKEHVIGKTLFDLFPTTDKTFLTYFEPSFKEGKTNTFETYHSYLQSHFSGTVCPLEDKLIFTCYDIGKRMKALEQLKESEERHRSIFENSGSIMMLIDPSNGDIVDANNATVLYIGFSKTKLLQMKIDDLNIADSAHIKENLNLAQANKKNYFEFHHRIASGEIRNVEVHTSAIHHQGKTLLHSIIHDVTDKKNALRELLILSKAVEQAPASIVITSSDGRIEYTNPQNCMLTGYDMKELIGKNSRF